MPGICLLLLDQLTLRGIVEAPDELARLHGFDCEPDRELVQQVAAQTAQYQESVAARPPWIGRLAWEITNRRAVGVCNFKGNPTPDGTVEIAYFTFPQYENQGYATAMAQALVTQASAAPEVRRILAHTLPEQNASARVLAKLGFQHLGAVIDPEDGLVWRWEKLLVRDESVA